MNSRSLFAADMVPTIVHVSVGGELHKYGPFEVAKELCQESERETLEALVAPMIQEAVGERFGNGMVFAIADFEFSSLNPEIIH